MKRIIILMAVFLLLTGCAAVTQPAAEENTCVDANTNGICDDKEVPASTPNHIEEAEPEEEPLDPAFLAVIGESSKVKSYHYIKKTYEGGLEAKDFKEKYEVYYKSGLMKQLVGAKVYYKNNDGVFDYVRSENESRFVSSAVLKKDTLFTEFEGISNVVIEDNDYVLESTRCVVATYEKAGSSYRAIIWKYYGIPIQIEINNEENTGTIIRYETDVNHVTEEDVTLPDSIIVQ